ncbi:MAG TPA: serine/threonine-protein kinase, partial [Ktedonobacteraceae bacterium]|nr:serine/threonine-protein kinase [Ktedonobacteraceae bacterium]
MTTTRGQHLIGQVIGSYILEKLLGYGGSSAVFLAQNRLTHEKVAVKVFLPRSTMDRQGQKNFYQRFLREAEATSELEHPNILSIYSYGQHDGLPYIVMSYMSGGTLSEYVMRNGPLPLNQAPQYLEQIASALDYAHENGRVHCDVKPANILLESQDHVVLSDFGIVQFIQPNGQNAEQSLKSPDTLMGTPDYISPEQALGEPVDGRSDVYSLGVTLFFLLAGRPPFQADSSITMALMHVHDTPPLLSTFRSDITPEIDRVLAKALSKWPEERYQTAGLFSAAFAEAVANADNYVLSDSEAKMKAMVSSGSAKKAKIASKLTPQGIFPSKGSPKVWRIALPLILLLAVIIGSTLSVFLVNNFTNTNHRPKSTPTSLSTDYLANSYAWPSGRGTNYFFQNRTYHIVSKRPTDFSVALYNFGNTKFTNFRITVTTSEIHGVHDNGDYYGLVLRSSANLQNYYLFEITPSGEGQYGFWRSGKQIPLKSDSVSFIKLNSDENNVISILVKNNTFTFFVNNKQLGKPFTDTSNHPLRSGAIGLSVEGDNTEVAFS